MGSEQATDKFCHLVPKLLYSFTGTWYPKLSKAMSHEIALMLCPECSHTEIGKQRLGWQVYNIIYGSVLIYL